MSRSLSESASESNSGFMVRHDSISAVEGNHLHSEELEVQIFLITYILVYAIICSRPFAKLCSIVLFGSKGNQLAHANYFLQVLRT